MDCGYIKTLYMQLRVNMSSAQNWSTVFRIALTTDSVLFIMKSALVAWLTAYIKQDKIRWYGSFDGVEDISESESDMFRPLLYVFWYCGIVILFILIILRWLNNLKQYQNENRTLNATSSENARNVPQEENAELCCSCCCKSSCWFLLGILNIMADGYILSRNWCSFTQGLDINWTCEYPKEAAISLLFWELFMFAFVLIYKINQSGLLER